MNTAKKNLLFLVVIACSALFSSFIILQNAKEYPFSHGGTKRRLPTAIAPSASVAFTIPEPSFTKGTVTLMGLAFDLPKNWIVQKTQRKMGGQRTEDTAFVSVPDPKYHVQIPISVSNGDEWGKSNAPYLVTTASGAKIYKIDGVVPPSLGNFVIVVKGTSYNLDVDDPISDEPNPYDDGPWAPSTTVTWNTILQFVTTVR